MGKANIRHTIDKGCRVEFRRKPKATSRESEQRQLSMVLRPSVRKELERVEPGGIERLAKSLYVRRFDRLFSSTGA
jgi:hypothetical protein